MSILLADIDATCASLGFCDGEKYIAEPDALQGLKHLIWILRRDLDNHEYRRHLGHSKILQSDLVYMLAEFIEEEEMSDVLIRLLIILTNPINLMYRDGPPKDNRGRKVYLELVEILQSYKSAFVDKKIWEALFKKMQQALQVDWSLRSEEQSLIIERILVLMRNVLQVPANSEADNGASIHDQVILSLYHSSMLDLQLFIISCNDEHQYHLHGLEILYLVYREQSAESLADATLQRSDTEKERDERELVSALKLEKQRLTVRAPTARHSRFGGTYVIRNMKSVSDRDVICHQPLERVVALDFDHEKQQQKPSFRHVRETAKTTRRSTFAVRVCLREFCIAVLRSAYNTLVRQVRRVLEKRGNSSGNDDSYLLWVIHFFMEFKRVNKMELALIGESLSVQCFHWVLTRMQHNMEMITTDKSNARRWAMRLHVALLAFRELLLNLLELPKLGDENALALYDMLLNNVCYVLEYRETVLHLLINYNEAHSTKLFLGDVIVTAHIFLKLMEKFGKDTVLVQEKKRHVKKRKPKPVATKETQLTEEEFIVKWDSLSNDVLRCLENIIELSESQLPIPFDATLEKSIEDQKEDCMIRIHELLHDNEMAKAVALLRAAREVWSENDVFGAVDATTDDEHLILREIFIHNIKDSVERNNVDANLNDEEEVEDDEENEEYAEEDEMVEKTFKFDDFAKRLLNGKIVRACTVVLSEWQKIPTKSLKAAVSILHRIAYVYSCPAMLYQARLFRIFQQVFHAPRSNHEEELRRVGKFVVRKFLEMMPKNPKIFAELLFYKSIKEANELESGYCDAYESGTTGTWTFEQEEELRCLFEENQRNPETDKDVIDWLLDNLIDKTRTRRGVLKKLKELELMFKAPTKKSSASAASKNQWKEEEDEELRSLYDQYRVEEDCLQRIVSEFNERRSKQQIIKRMLQLHIIADKSEILPKKTPKARSRKKKDQLDLSEDDEEPVFDKLRKQKSTKAHKKSKSQAKSKKQVAKRTIVPMDVDTVKVLMAEVDGVKYAEALEWLKECLNDAAEDTDDDQSDELDGVPLVPLLEITNEAMEDENFKKVLLAFGIQPPIGGMETFWRIPTHLTARDLQMRAKILGGEKIDDYEMADFELENSESGMAVDESDSDASSESEEDYLENLQRDKNTEEFKESEEQPQTDVNVDVRDLFDQLKSKRANKKKHLEDENDIEEELNKSSDSSDNDLDVTEKKRRLKKTKPVFISDDEEEQQNEEEVEQISHTMVEFEKTKDDTSGYQEAENLGATNKRQRSPSTTTFDTLTNKVDDPPRAEFNLKTKKPRLIPLVSSDSDD